MTGGCWWSRDIAAVHQQHFFSFQLALPNGRAEEKKFVEDSAAQPVCRMKKLMELIYEWSMKGWIGQLNKQSEIKSNEFHNWFIWLIRLVWLEWNCFFLLLWLGGPSQPALSAGWKRWVMGAGTPSQQAKQKEENNGMKAGKESSAGWLRKEWNEINEINWNGILPQPNQPSGPPSSPAARQAKAKSIFSFRNKRRKVDYCCGANCFFFSSSSINQLNSFSLSIKGVDWMKERELIDWLFFFLLWVIGRRPI